MKTNFDPLLIKKWPPVSKISQNDRLDDTLHRHRRHHRDRQHVVKPAVSWHISRTEIPNSLNLKLGHGVQKPDFDLPVFFLSLQRPCRRWQKTQCNNEGAQNLGKNAFLRCALFLWWEANFWNKMFQTTCFLVDPLCDLYGFSSAHTVMFFLLPQKGGLKPRREIEIRSRDCPASKFRSPGPPKGTHSGRKVGPFLVWETKKAQG